MAQTRTASPTADASKGDAKSNEATQARTTRSATARRPLGAIEVPNVQASDAPKEATVSADDARKVTPEPTSTQTVEAHPAQVHPTEDGEKKADAPAPAKPVATPASSSQDATDFLARAKALGLNLTLQDYERARAGVSAFLRAERVGASKEAASSSSATTSGSTKAGSDAKQGALRRVTASRAPQTSANAGASNVDVHKKPAHTGTQLSFFTAVVPSPSPEKEKKASRPTLDDISILIERRRRREKRRRLQERAERAGSEADCETGMHLRKARTSSASTLVPLVQSSPALGSKERSSSPWIKGSDSKAGVAGLPQARPSEEDLMSANALRRVDSASALDLPVDFGSKTSSVPNPLRSPVRLLQVLKGSPSPSLTRLNRRVHIDDDGVLQLLATPQGDVRDRYSSHDLESDDMADTTNIDDDEVVTSGAATVEMDTDDSGVCFVREALGKKKQWPRSHRRRTSSLGSLTMHSGNNEGLGFLDRIMAQKRSPRRLRREAKAREQQARYAAQNDIVVMTATTAAPAQEAALTAAMPPPPPVIDRESNATSSEPAHPQPANTDGKTVRWANEFGSPRKRITTKEIYDLEFYGMSQGVSHGHHASGSFGGWEQFNSYLNGNGSLSHLPGSASKNRRLSIGSPNPTRHRSNSSIDASLGIFSLGENERGLAGHTLRRGLLFANGSGDATSTPSGSSLDGAFGDFSNVFSHGPTLACSPARKSLDAGETPPRLGLVRANTLATPFMYSQSQSSIEYGMQGSLARAFGSPDRGSLLRSHSTGDVRRSHSRKPSLLSLSYTHDEDKENSEQTFTQGSDDNSSRHGSFSGSSKAPTGWAHRSPFGKAYPTVSPLAIFGLQGQQGEAHQPQLQAAQDVQPMAANNREQQDQHMKSHFDENNDARQNRHRSQQAISDNEGDDERDDSPIHRSKGRARAPIRSASHHAAGPGQIVDGGHVRRSSQSSHSALGGSPLMLDMRNGHARVVPSPTKVNEAPSAAHTSSQGSQARRRKKQPQHELAPPVPMQSEMTPGNGDMGHGNAAAQAPFGSFPSQLGMQMEFLQGDGSTLVRLISEELEQALKSGTMVDEPPPRYYRLPPNSGISNAKPQSSSYAGMIGQAILSSSDGRLSLNEIYNWIATVYPFFERGDRGWQNSIRHNLSLNKSFMKVEREAHNPGKGGLWAIKPGHEMCFRAGNYFAPGSAKSAANAREASRAFANTPKTPHNGMPLSNMPFSDVSAMSGMSGPHASVPARRKRQNSEKSTMSEHASDTDGQQVQNGLARVSSKAKRSRSNASKRRILQHANSPDQVEAQLTVMSQPHGQPLTMSQMAMMKPARMQPHQGMHAYSSPRDFNTITPNRPYQPRHMDTNSSDIGSAYASSVMASMPMLTDASSPPSSPQTVMPPPAGGSHGASNTKSAQKRRKSGHFHAAIHNNVFVGPNYMAAPGAGHSWGSGMPANMFSMPQGMHSSPLANLRNHNVIMSSNPMMSASGTSKSTYAGNAPYGASGSPTRRSAASPSRLLMQSPPVSSVRNSGPENRTRHMKTASFGKSPSKMLVPHSPLRGSPLRPGGPLNQSMHVTASPAGMSMQMALSGTSTSAQQDGSSFSNFGGEGGEATSTGLTPLTQRFSYTSPSPSRRLMESSFSPAFGTPGMHAQATGHANPNSFDDPFGYSGNLQHELDLASMTTEDVMHHHLGSSFGAVEPSPMKGMYMQPHLYGNVPGGASMTYDSPTKSMHGVHNSSVQHSLHGAY